MKLFGTFEKVEEQADGTLKVYGHASSEAEDAQGEIVKASAMEKAMPDYLKFGAVREMHSNIAAGTAIEMAVEADGRTSFGAHVVDPVAVKKVQTKVYKGFSIGGTVTERDATNKKIITGLKLTEISLVDRPANPDATFSLFKADGVVVPDTDTSDPAAAKAEEPAPVADATGEPAKEVKKSMYSLASFASVLSSISSLASDAQWEAEYEKDDSPVPASLRDWLKAGLGIFNSMAAEESAELIETLKPKEAKVVALADAPADLAKVETPDVKKLADDLSKLTTENELLKKRVDELEKMPAAPKGVARVVGKADDVVDPAANDEPEDKSPLGLMKKAQQNPTLIKL